MITKTKELKIKELENELKSGNTNITVEDVERLTKIIRGEEKELTPAQIYRKEYYRKNKEALKAKSREYYENNKEYWVEYRARDNGESHNRYHRERKQNNPIEKLIHNLRVRTSTGLKKFINGGESLHTLELLKVSDKKTFMNYLESQFLEEMTWENYGTVWELDHIFPISKINKADSYELSLVSHYTNIRPAYRTDNRRKSAKLDLQYKVVQDIVDRIEMYRGTKLNFKFQDTEFGVM